MTERPDLSRFRAADYEPAPPAEQKQLTHAAAGRIRGLQNAGRRSATKRFYCPECRMILRPINMLRHRGTHYR